MGDSECLIFEEWLNEVEKLDAGPNRCSPKDTACYLNLGSASPEELDSARTLFCDSCGCDADVTVTLVIIVAVEVVAIALFHRFIRVDQKFYPVLIFGLLLRGIFLPAFPHCLVAVGYLAHLAFPVRGWANLVAILVLDALCPQTAVAIAVAPVRLYCVALGFERAVEYKTSPAEEVNEKYALHAVDQKPHINAVYDIRKHAMQDQTSVYVRDEPERRSNSKSSFAEQSGISFAREKVNPVVYTVAITICVMLCLQIPWSAEPEAPPGTSCPGIEGFAPCNPWHTVSTHDAVDAAQCCSSCDSISECQGWVYKPHGNSCWLFKYSSCPNGVCEPCMSYPGQFYGAKI